MNHNGQKRGPEPKSLEWFQASEIDSAGLNCLTTVNMQRKLEAKARKGDRRLPVTSTLYRATLH